MKAVKLSMRKYTIFNINNTTKLIAEAIETPVAPKSKAKVINVTTNKIAGIRKPNLLDSLSNNDNDLSSRTSVPTKVLVEESTAKTNEHNVKTKKI